MLIHHVLGTAQTYPANTSLCLAAGLSAPAATALLCFVIVINYTLMSSASYSPSHDFLCHACGVYCCAGTHTHACLSLQYPLWHRSLGCMVYLRTCILYPLPEHYITHNAGFRMLHTLTAGLLVPAAEALLCLLQEPCACCRSPAVPVLYGYDISQLQKRYTLISCRRQDMQEAVCAMRRRLPVLL